MIPQSFIQDLLNRVDIVDVVGRHVQLKKSGANLMGLCPFHNEKSPSFTVSPTKQFYHCFGCGAHGTAIGFMIEYSGMGFVDAVKDLAQNVGMKVPDSDDRLPPAQRAEKQAKSMALSEAMQRASDFYRHQLRSATEAITYLKGRGLTGEIAARFGVGFAPDRWDGLKAVFADYADAVLVESGLVIDREDEDSGQHKRYDRFRNRIMFPIRNTKGQVIAFGGRVMDGSEPKYLNSPETPLFQKGNELYGLFEARQAIREAGYVLVTEGYMDVVALAQLGFPQAVATLGTACTPAHVNKLLRQTDHLIFSFDGDAAGRRAARRALEACLPHAQDNKTIRFLFLPKEHDPDSYVREHGAEEFARQIKEALPLSQFLIREVIGGNDMQSIEGRARMQFEAKPLLQLMQPSALRMQLVQSLAQLARVDTESLETAFELVKPSTRRPARQAPSRVNRAAPVGLMRQLLKLLVAHPVLAAELEPAFLQEAQEALPEQAVVLNELVALCRSTGDQASFSVLSEQLRNADTDTDWNALVAEIAMESESEPAVARLELDGAIRQLRMQINKRQLDALALEGLHDEAARHRYRALMLQQERLRQDAASGSRSVDSQ